MKSKKKALTSQEKQVQAAIWYGKDTWCNLEDLKPLFYRGTDKLQDIPDRACSILAAEVERLRKEITRLESVEPKKPENFKPYGPFQNY
jgi:hypothetical protein